MMMPGGRSGLSALSGIQAVEAEDDGTEVEGALAGHLEVVGDFEEVAEAPEDDAELAKGGAML